MVPLLLATVWPTSSDSLREYRILADHKQYFDLRNQLAGSKSSETETMYFRAIVEEKFNRLESANKLFATYLSRGGKKRLDVYRSMASNYARLGQYGRAEQAYRSILKYPKVKDAEDIANVAGLWGAIKEVPPQTVAFAADTDIELTRDFNVTIDSNGQKLKFIFDTGANISTVSQTFAEKLGLRLYDTKVMVGGITGASTQAKLGVSKELRLGNVIVRNAVFLVFPDKDLFIKAANFQLNGILGFPVISELGELTITRSGRMLIPKTPVARGLNNLALDGLSPLILGKYGTRRFTFALDSGANVSMLYPPFFHAMESEISRYEKTQHRFAGVGSARSLPAFQGKDLKLAIGGQEVVFPKIPILTEPTNEASHVVYGNLGQDMIRQFESMTINFAKMSVEFGSRVSSR